MALTLSSNNFEVNIHPVALFNIVHAYERRSEKFDTILGTLLGKINSNYNLKSSFDLIQVHVQLIQSKLSIVLLYHIQHIAK